MAKAKQPTGEMPQDTSRHAKTAHQGQYGDKGDMLYVPGEGFYLGQYAKSDMERARREQAVAHGEPKFDDARYHKLFIAEEEIKSWYREIQTVEAMSAAGSKRDKRRTAYEATCYEDTDTQDPTKTGDELFTKRNDHRLDHSQSTAQLSTASSTPIYLNGSAVRHQHYVRMQFTSPDGRRLISVHMTFDQLASFLVSNSSTPCTINEYWSMTNDSVLLQEVVKEPETIHGRMEQRLGDRLDDMKARLDAVLAELDGQITSGKGMSKTRLIELRGDLDVYKTHFDVNRDFVVEQAREEVTSIVEQAATGIAWQHKLSPDELLASPHIVTLLETLNKHKAALPAPEPKA